MSGAPAAGRPLQILVDGRPGSTIPAVDRGLQYGDGLFETLLVRRAQPCQWSRHLNRLRAGASLLRLPIGDTDRLHAEASAVAAGLGDGVLKLLITRGSGGRGYRPPAEAAPLRILLAYPPPQYPSSWAELGVRVRYCTTRAALNPSLAGVKHLNRLDSVLARCEWDDPDVAEGLMLDPAGDLVGGTMTNLFVWNGSELATPRIEGSGIAGTVRALTLEVAGSLGIPVREADVRIADLDACAGLFLTNALVAVWPVRELEGRVFDPRRLPEHLLAAVRDAARAPG